MINQKMVDKVFCEDGSHYVEKDCQTIQSTLKEKYKINLSLSEAKKFWRWRCENADYYLTPWLSTENKKDEIISWFEDYIKEYFNKDD